ALLLGGRQEEKRVDGGGHRVAVLPPLVLDLAEQFGRLAVERIEAKRLAQMLGGGIEVLKVKVDAAGELGGRRADRILHPRDLGALEGAILVAFLRVEPGQADEVRRVDGGTAHGIACRLDGILVGRPDLRLLELAQARDGEAQSEVARLQPKRELEQIDRLVVPLAVGEPSRERDELVEIGRTVGRRFRLGHRGLRGRISPVARGSVACCLRCARRSMTTSPPLRGVCSCAARTTGTAASSCCPRRSRRRAARSCRASSSPTSATAWPATSAG